MYRLLQKHYRNYFSRFVRDQQILHPYLVDSLQRNGIVQLKDFQMEMLHVASKNKNCFINSCTGSGKTLAYLIPILNRILKEKQAGVKNSSHGSIILTLNKQLVLQIYKLIRVLDPASKIVAKRTGPISHYIPVITQLNNKPTTRDQNDQIDRKINQNLVNTVKWSTTDVLISTPQLLSNIIRMSINRQPINPSSVVIDEADLLLELDKNVSRHTEAVFDLFSKVSQQQRQYLISASSFPKKMKKVDSQQALTTKFKDLIFVIGEQKHQIPSNIDLFSIELDILSQKNKNYYLRDILTAENNDKIIIFCNNKQSVEDVRIFVENSLQMPCLEYHASLDSNSRSRVLHRFGQGPEKILISTDLGSRGLDFGKPINLIIEYEMADNITVFMNRVGRTGRNRIPGKVITFVQEKNRLFFDHITEVVSHNEQLDQLFSRKKSYSRLYNSKS